MLIGQPSIILQPSPILGHHHPLAGAIMPRRNMLYPVGGLGSFRKERSFKSCVLQWVLGLAQFFSWHKFKERKGREKREDQKRGDWIWCMSSLWPLPLLQPLFLPPPVSPLSLPSLTGALPASTVQGGPPTKGELCHFLQQCSQNGPPPSPVRSVSGHFVMTELYAAVANGYV